MAPSPCGTGTSRAPTTVATVRDRRGTRRGATGPCRPATRPPTRAAASSSTASASGALEPPAVGADILAGPGSSEPVARLPVTIYAGTRYVAEITTPETDHADPEDPLRPSRGTERRLTLGVTTREDYKRRAKQRDKVQLAFNDFTRKRNLLVDIESPEERFVAFDIMFDPTYELAPNTIDWLSFPGLALGMFNAWQKQSWEKPFSNR